MYTSSLAPRSASQALTCPPGASSSCWMISSRIAGLSVSRTSITDRRLRNLGGLFLAGETLAPAPYRRDELREIHLERVEDLVGVVLGTEPDLALAPSGVLDDVLGGARGLLGDF